MRRVWVLVVALWGGVTVLAAAQSASAPTADEFAARVQAHYQSIQDFSADFVHTYRGGALRQTTTERGHLVVKKPGRTRWEYEVPERKTFVSDGQTSYFYVPADREVIVTEAGSDATTTALFLAGRGDVSRDFVASYEPTDEAPPDTIVLKLVPHTAETEFDWLLIAVDPDTLDTRMLVSIDAQGGRSTFTFSNLEFNRGVPDRTFVFAVPRGVDVIRY